MNLFYSSIFAFGLDHVIFQHKVFLESVTIVEVSQVMASILSAIILEQIFLESNLNLLKLIDSFHGFVVNSSFLDNIFQNVKQKLRFVSLSVSIFFELFAQLSRHRHFLGLQERLKKHIDSKVYIISADMIS